MGNEHQGLSVQELKLSLDDRSVHYQLSPEKLINQTLSRNEGKISDTGALAVNTGKFTGRSPKDRFIVYDNFTADIIDWNDINQPIESKYFDRLYNEVVQYLKTKEVWVRDNYACADIRYKLNIRSFSETPWASLFCYNMFQRPDKEELTSFIPDWDILVAPNFFADPEVHGVRQENFSIINFEKKTILIGGTAYTGEIKKGIFSVLNCLLPHKEDVLSMHCSANVGEKGDTALFFGLSGTGKTTLSADPQRQLIGDDEHGWAADSVFNFEGGCYAKCINLNEEQEPQIYGAVKKGALLENVGFFENSNRVNYKDKQITENTRVSYPIDYISNAIQPSIGGTPENIFFLTCDASGVLPPISRLTIKQAVEQFVLGYTAKVAGTEAGILEPKSVFSYCYGAPFMPLSSTCYAEMLADKIKKHKTKCWLVNTGWTGGKYGVGNRIPLNYTRALIRAVFTGSIEKGGFQKDPIFDLSVPFFCKGVPDEMLLPRETWANKNSYDKEAKKLLSLFKEKLDSFY